MTSKKTSKACVAALLPVLLISACKMGPDYKKPDTTVPENFRSQIAMADASSFADMPWWNVFNDYALQGLLHEALRNNYDLQVAVARVEQARASVGSARSEGLPQVGYDGAAGRERSLILQENSAGPATFNSFEGLLSAAWEIDVWGRVRRSVEAAQANLLAQEDVRRGVVLTLVSDVAGGYFRLVELDRELLIAEESARTYRSTLGLFNDRFTVGRDSKLPVERARAAYESSLAKIEELRRQIAQQENALSVLVGSDPRAIIRGKPLIEQTVPTTPPGTTTAVLQRRPDILQSEQTMIAANAEIGVAVASYFPRIGLSAFGGGQGVDVAGNTASFGVWGFALNVSGPIFTSGRLRAEYQRSQAFWDESVAQYKKTVLVAFQETSDALVAQQRLKDRRTALEGQVAALQNSVDLALLRYRGGRASYIEVLEAQQQLFPAKDSLAQNQRDQLLAVVNLYRALGGGWQTTVAEAAQAP